LYERVQGKIAVEDFDQPFLKKIAQLVFNTLQQEPNADLGRIMVKAETVEEGSLLAELAQAGEEKGNFEKRLDKAMEVILRQRKHGEIQTIVDKDKYLKRLSEQASDENRHSLGMIY